jgi:hypothetical protein
MKTAELEAALIYQGSSMAKIIPLARIEPKTLT